MQFQIYLTEKSSWILCLQTINANVYMLGHVFQDFPLNTISKRETEFSLFSLATVKHKINSVSPSLELHKSSRLRFQEPV